MIVSVTKIQSLVLVLALTPFSLAQSSTPERPKKFGHSLSEFEKRSTQQPQKATQFDDGEVLRVETNLVIADVLMVDKSDPK